MSLKITIHIPQGSDSAMHRVMGQRTKCGKKLGSFRAGMKRVACRAFICVKTTTPGHFPDVIEGSAWARTCKKCWPHGLIIVAKS